MNEHTPPTPPDALPAELLAIGKALDELAALDRAAAGPLFEQRLAESTLPGLPLAEHVEALAGADRSAASSTLEDRIFVATRGLLNRPIGVSADDAPAPAPIPMPVAPGRALRFRSVLRIAAVLAMCGAAGLIYWATRPDVPPALNTDASVASSDLASDLDDDFDSLGAILSVAQGSDDATVSGAVLLESDVNDLDFPRLDLLDVEGSL